MGNRANESEPKWFTMGNPKLWTILQYAHKSIQARKSANTNLNSYPVLASIHLHHSLDASITLNIKGQHALAISLLRQCVECLTLVEIGTLETGYGDVLLENWANESKPGHLRKALEKDIWPKYGSGLWNETWSKFFGEFAGAVQPYAHYTHLLMGWQMANVNGEKLIEKDGEYMFISEIGFKTYDAVKATRITLLHCLLGWVTARILLENNKDPGITEAEIKILGNEIGKSELLGGGKLDWHTEFWPQLFDHPLKAKKNNGVGNG